MIDKAFIESFLRVNNTSVDDSDDAIKNVLHKAKWTGDEIKSALALLRGKAGVTNVVAVSKGKGSIFRPDFNYSSDKLSVLLGVDVVIDPSSLHYSIDSPYTKLKHSIEQFFIGLFIVLISLVVAVGIGFFIAYITQVGPFDSPISTSII